MKQTIYTKQHKYLFKQKTPEQQIQNDPEEIIFVCIKAFLYYICKRQRERTKRSIPDQISFYVTMMAQMAGNKIINNNNNNNTPYPPALQHPQKWKQLCDMCFETCCCLSKQGSAFFKSHRDEGTECTSPPFSFSLFYYCHFEKC